MKRFWTLWFLHFVALLSLEVVGKAIPWAVNSQVKSSNEVHQLQRRELPKFTRFDKSKKEDRDRLDKIKKAFHEVKEMVDAIQIQDQVFDKIFEKYFENKHKPVVLEVFRNMVEPAHKDAATGSDHFSEVTVTNKDLNHRCSPPFNGKHVAAYAWAQVGQIHFCGTEWRNTYEFPSLSEIHAKGSADLGNHVSWKMSSFSGVLLHELSHLYLISASAVKHHVNEDGLPRDASNIPAVIDVIQGPQEARALRQSENAKNRLSTVINAENYTWFAKELYWTRKASRYFKDPETNQSGPPGSCKDPEEKKKIKDKLDEKCSPQ